MLLTSRTLQHLDGLFTSVACKSSSVDEMFSSNLKSVCSVRQIYVWIYVQIVLQICGRFFECRFCSRRQEPQIPSTQVRQRFPGRRFLQHNVDIGPTKSKC